MARKIMMGTPRRPWIGGITMSLPVVLWVCLACACLLQPASSYAISGPRKQQQGLSLLADAGLVDGDDIISPAPAHGMNMPAPISSSAEGGSNKTEPEVDCESCTHDRHVWCKSTPSTLSFTDGVCIISQHYECAREQAVSKPWMCPVGRRRSYWGVFNFVILTLAAWLVGSAFQALQLPVITGVCGCVSLCGRGGEGGGGGGGG